jgi:serine phosphatase RsbU (regulator of sigma subunit)
LHDEVPGEEAVDGRTVYVRRATVPTTQSRADRVHFLIEEVGHEVGRRIELGLKPLSIGRAPPADLVLPDPDVSRQHCRLEVKMEALFVTDLNSTNGTFINDRQVEGNMLFPVGASLAIGDHVFRHEWRDRKELAQSQELTRDLEKARHYVQSLLPPPLAQGPVLTEWLVLPSAALGGDALGYHWLDDSSMAMYLVDVSGHGAGPAMHTVSVINVLRHQALPKTNFRQPAEVLANLNAIFQMDRHDDMYFTIWYGVYEPASRTLRYASGGHHPAFLLPPGRDGAQPLQTYNLAIGMAPDVAFKAEERIVEPGSSMYLFSDGVFEIETPEGEAWTLSDFLPYLLQERAAGVPEPKRLHAAVTAVSGRDTFDDDFSMLVASFP